MNMLGMLGPARHAKVHLQHVDPAFLQLFYQTVPDSGLLSSTASPLPQGSGSRSEIGLLMPWSSSHSAFLALLACQLPGKSWNWQYRSDAAEAMMLLLLLLIKM